MRARGRAGAGDRRADGHAAAAPAVPAGSRRICLRERRPYLLPGHDAAHGVPDRGGRALARAAHADRRAAGAASVRQACCGAPLDVTFWGPGRACQAPAMGACACFRSSAATQVRWWLLQTHRHALEGRRWPAAKRGLSKCSHTVVCENGFCARCGSGRALAGGPPSSGAQGRALGRDARAAEAGLGARHLLLLDVLQARMPRGLFKLLPWGPDRTKFRKCWHCCNTCCAN